MSNTTDFVGDGGPALVEESTLLDGKESLDRMEATMQTARAYQQEMVDESLRQNTIIAVSYPNAYYR